MAVVGGEGKPKDVQPRTHYGNELHSVPGMQAVNRRLAGAVKPDKTWGQNRQQVLAELRKLKAEILSGQFPP
jgi:hypothetical protein